MKSYGVTCLGVLLMPMLPFAHAAAEQQGRASATLSNPVAAQSLEALSATLDRPLFSPSRRPPPPPPAAAQVLAPSAPAPSPPNVALYGVVMDGESARAVVRGADNKILRAQIGDDIGGWTVSQIEGRKVVLSFGGRNATFTLFTRDREGKQGVAEPAARNESRNPQQTIQAQQATTTTVAPQSVQPGKRRRSRE